MVIVVRVNLMYGKNMTMHSLRKSNKLNELSASSGTRITFTGKSGPAGNHENSGDHICVQKHAFDRNLGTRIPVTDLWDLNLFPAQLYTRAFVSALLTHKLNHLHHVQPVGLARSQEMNKAGS